MTYSVLLVPEIDGQVTAILKNQHLSVTAPTREDALAHLRHRAERILTGQVEFTTMDLPSPRSGGLMALAGSFADDPHIQDIVSDAYAARDASSDDCL